MSIFDQLVDSSDETSSLENHMDYFELEAMRHDIAMEGTAIMNEINQSIISLNHYMGALEATNGSEKYAIALEKEEGKQRGIFKKTIDKIRAFIKKIVDFVKKVGSTIKRKITGSKKEKVAKEKEIGNSELGGEKPKDTPVEKKKHEDKPVDKKKHEEPEHNEPSDVPDDEETTNDKSSKKASNKRKEKSKKFKRDRDEEIKSRNKKNDKPFKRKETVKYIYFEIDKTALSKLESLPNCADETKDFYNSNKEEIRAHEDEKYNTGLINLENRSVTAMNDARQAAKFATGSELIGSNRDYDKAINELLSSADYVEKIIGGLGNTLDRFVQDVYMQTPEGHVATMSRLIAIVQKLVNTGSTVGPAILNMIAALYDSSGKVKE